MATCLLDERAMKNAINFASYACVSNQILFIYTASFKGNRKERVYESKKRKAVRNLGNVIYFFCDIKNHILF